ncbi:MAG TPA: hypothetical protein VIJ15_01515 [Dermatophilaceae bacterium]
MSPSDSDRFAQAATLRHLLKNPRPASAAHESDASAPDDNAGERTQTTRQWEPRPVNPARVGLSRHGHARPYNDPSNYLG